MRKRLFLKITCFVVIFITAFVVFIQHTYLEKFATSYLNVLPTLTKCSSSRSRKHYTDKRRGDIKITWFIPPVFLMYRPDAMFSGFVGCSYSNCKLSYVKSDAADSDAVIFTGRLIPETLPFTRPSGQIWIFYEHEPPYRYSEMTHRWNQSNSFNWTMTYDSSISDIHLPYGDIVNKTSKTNANLDKILQSKNGKALIILSHCETPSNRLRYIGELQKFFEVDVLGNCGTQWDCGQRFAHDDCFKILNQYKFYLAFENSFCNNYFTEKIFANFDFDTVLVSRGGKKGQNKQILPEGTFISTDDFKNAKDLGIYLRSMSDETYMNILKKKQKYTSLDSYTMVFHKALCNICERMNDVDKYQKAIKNMNDWAFHSKPCVQRNDV